jgi:Domain of unknown function (DUF4314)
MGASEYPPRGARLRLVRCTDPHTRLRPGDEGVVNFVDSAGTVHVQWDNGSNLGLIRDDGDDFEVIAVPTDRDRRERSPGMSMFSRRRVLQQHLRSVAGPEVSDALVDSAERAIELANGGRFRAEVAMPDGSALSALECLDRYHLETFVDGFDS